MTKSAAGSSPIDAVITWVNGNTAAHSDERAKYMAQATAPLHENAINTHRWTSSNEILYCLQSIENYAPWIRKIWIVIDSETPNLASLSTSLRNKIHFVTHSEIFGAFTDALPTFNSLAIESMIWRIEGLSEHFIYFNDDVFLSAPLQPEDVFIGQSPVLRGQWKNFSNLLQSPEALLDPAQFHHFMQINAATIAGLEASHIFASAHVVHPIRRSIMAYLFVHHAKAFRANIYHRFRDLSQFLPQSLHNFTCIIQKNAILHDASDSLHIWSGQGIGAPAAETLALLEKAQEPQVKFLCINDLPQLEMIIPQARDQLAKIIGGFPSQSSPL